MFIVLFHFKAANMLANNCVITYPADTLFGVEMPVLVHFPFDKPTFINR